MKKRLENLPGKTGLQAGDARERKTSIGELNETRLRGEVPQKDYGEMKDEILKDTGFEFFEKE